MSEEKELFEWVEIPHEYAATKSPRWEYLPSSGSWVHTDKGYNWFYQGVFYTDTFYGTRVYPKEWLKPITFPDFEVTVNPIVKSKPESISNSEIEKMAKNSAYENNMLNGEFEVGFIAGCKAIINKQGSNQ